MKSVAFHNLGCKVNSYEIEVMQQKLQENGFVIVPFDTKADIYIVNTCTVTNIADRKSRQMLHRAKQLNPEAVVVAVGCYVQTGEENVKKDDSVDLMIGNNRKKDIVEILMNYLIGEHSDKTLNETTVLDINHTYEYEEMQLKHTADHTRAYIKIQDGCNQFCAYCAIPLARGRVRSRKAEDILAEIETMVAAGYREVVLTGIHISSYGIDFDNEAWRQGQCVKPEGAGHPEYTGESKFIDLVERIQQVEGLDRIRLGSLEPRIVTEETAKRLAALDKLCPHFHLSLQSGCDATLKRMNRRYSAEEYYHSVEALRNSFERPAITTDVIVGFPGETVEEFEETRAFLEKVSFYEMHIFKYSKRAGTRAAVMKEQIPERIKTERSNQLFDMEQRQSKAFREYWIGKTVEVLPEENKEINGLTVLLGHTRDYVKVALPMSQQYKVNKPVQVKIKEFLTDEILLAE